MTAAVNHTKTTTTASSVDAATTLASQDVGLLFVREYYTFLNKKPLRLHAFYNKDSFFVRGDEGETVQTYHGQDEIRQKIEELNFEDCKVLVTQVDSQASANNGILIQVLGEMCVKDGPSQKFSQTFFLAPQPNGYYVLNDIFRFLKDEVDIDYYTCEDDQQQQQQQPTATETKKEQQEDVVATTVEKQQQPSVEPAAPATKKQPPPSTTVEPPVQVDGPKPDEKKKKAAAVNGDTTAPAAAAAAAAVPTTTTTEKPSTLTSKPSPTATPAAATAAEKTAEASPAPSPAPAAPATPRSWANMAANDSSKWGTQASEAKGSVAPTTPAATPPPQQQQPATPPVKEQQQQQNNKDQAPRKDEVTNIFVKGVNANVTEAQLDEAFSKFGPVRALNIVLHRNCAFLDFTTPEACQKALAQHKVSLSSGMVVLAEERRRPGAKHHHHHHQQPNGNYDQRRQQQQQQQQQQPQQQQQRGGYQRGSGGGGGRNNATNKSRPNTGK